MNFKYKIIGANMMTVFTSLLCSSLITVFAGNLLFNNYFDKIIFFPNRQQLGTMVESHLFLPFLTQLFLIFCIVFIVLFTIFNLIIMHYITSQFTKPLAEIKKGMAEIQQGNLEYPFHHYINNEVGEIFVAFNEMQLHLKKNIEKSLESDQNKLELISNISHDLRTPITTILGYTTGLLDGIADTEEKQRKYIQTIQTKAMDMENLIEQLLTSAKLDMNKMKFHFEKINMVTYINEIIDEIKFDLEKKQIMISIQDEGMIPIVHVDKPKIKRVILNIINNAIQYRKDTDSTIHIKIQNIDKSVVITITDNGIGIPEDKLPFIFQNFYRCSDARSEVSSNSGLGLAIAKLIVEGHNGHIWARSVLDVNTSLFISLPVVT